MINKGLSTITDAYKQILPIWQTCPLISFSVIDDTFRLSNVIIILRSPSFDVYFQKNQTSLTKDSLTKFLQAISQYVKNHSETMTRNLKWIPDALSPLIMPETFNTQKNDYKLLLRTRKWLIRKIYYDVKTILSSFSILIASPQIY